MSPRRHRWTAVCALLAAYALALQAVLAGVVPPTANGGLPALLCATSAETPTERDGPAPQRHDDCCIFCPASGLDATKPKGVTAPPQTAWTQRSTTPPVTDGSPPGTHERLPGHPRAPPA